jgi:hypothetical protein
MEQRKSQRFDLRLPVELLRCGSRTVEKAVESRNISSNGILFRSEVDLAPGEALEYLVTLNPGSEGQKPVKLYCMGKVVRRVDKGVAATLERYEFLRA